MTEASIRSRIQFLGGLEAARGFVHVGEKRWLESIQEGTAHSYDDWIIHQIRHVFPGGLQYQLGLYENQPSLLEWSAYTEDISMFTSFEELSETSLAMDYVLLTISGNAKSPNESCLCRAFEILHDIPYYLALADQGKWRESITLDEIWVPADSDTWKFELISDYGSAGTVNFRGDERIPASGIDEKSVEESRKRQ